MWAMNATQITNYVETVSATAAIMALIAGSVYKWRSRPRVVLRCLTDEFDPQAWLDLVVVRSEDQEIVECWLRLRVCAVSRRRAAKNVQVRVVSVVSHPGSGSMTVPTGPLTWSSTGPEPQSIFPGSWLPVDLLRYYIKHPDHDRGLHVAIGYSFDTGYSRTELRNGRYYIDLHVGGDDLPTTCWRVVVEHLANPQAETDEDIKAQLRLVALSQVSVRKATQEPTRAATSWQSQLPGLVRRPRT
jgi:hypothetical protein